MINIYCERLGPGLWAEPFNATTNIAFVIAAYFIWQTVKQRNIGNVNLLVLLVLMVAIAIGSTLFHTFANNWSFILDIVPILLFQIVYLWAYLVEIIKSTKLYTLAIMVVFIILLTLGFHFRYLANGSVAYIPTFMLIFGLAIYHYFQQKNHKHLLFYSAGIFLLALFFRSIDQTVCPNFPIGTHFMWHITNGYLLFFLLKALVFNINGRVVKGSA